MNIVIFKSNKLKCRRYLNEVMTQESEKTGNLQKNSSLLREIGLYFLFVILMIFLNMGIQNAFEYWVFPFINNHWGDNSFIKSYILSIDPYNIPELIGSTIAVGITYFTKFFLDKFIVFQKTEKNFKKTRKQFLLYFGFAILTTLENLGIQFILGVLTPILLNFRIVIALSCGYITKYLLDRKYSFKTS